MALELNQAIGIRVREARTAAGLTQDRLAEAIERTKETVSNIERGVNLPTLDTLERICRVLDVPIREMFPNEGVSRKRLEAKSRLDAAFQTLTDAQAAMLVDIAATIVRHTTGGKSSSSLPGKGAR